MKRMTLWRAGLVTAILFQNATLTILPGEAKVWSVEQRQAKLMQDVNNGQKSGKLTDKQSRKLRSKLADVARKKAKMLAKTNGKLTTEDKVKLQTRINKASTKIKEEQITKK